MKNTKKIRMRKSRKWRLPFPTLPHPHVMRGEKEEYEPGDVVNNATRL